MCLGIPMQIVTIDGYEARCVAKGIERVVSLFMLQDQAVNVGDHVLVHVGYAIQTLRPEDASATWQLLDQILEVEDGTREPKRA